MKRGKRQVMNGRLAKQASDGFENVTIIDRALWLDDDGNRHWYVALEAIDKRGDKGPLLKLLRSGQSLGPAIQGFLADLLQRYQLKRPRGRQATPTYDRSAREAMLFLAHEDIRDQRTKGIKIDVAIQSASKAYRVDKETLTASWAGKRGSTRRMAKRRKQTRP